MSYAAKSFDIGHVAHLLPDTRDIYVRCVLCHTLQEKLRGIIIILSAHITSAHNILYACILAITHENYYPIEWSLERVLTQRLSAKSKSYQFAFGRWSSSSSSSRVSSALYITTRRQAKHDSLLMHEGTMWDVSPTRQQHTHKERERKRTATSNDKQQKDR